MMKSESLQALAPSPPLKVYSRPASLRVVLKNLLFLLIGLILGIQFTLLWFNEAFQCSTLSTSSPIKIEHDGGIPKNLTQSVITYQETSSLGDATLHSSAQVSATNTNIVEYLQNTTRVLCWIMTYPENHQAKAIHIRNTWGRRCNTLLFMSSAEDEELPTIALPVEDGSDHLWNKTKLALKYIYDNHLDDADWFLRADDDTYVIMENLRFFLHEYPPEAPIYFGCKFGQHVPQGFMTGGAGYVLSKEALTRFATEAYDNSEICDELEVYEDVQLGKCLSNVGVIAGDSRDALGKERFVPMAPIHVIPDYKIWWYTVDVYHGPGENVTCCSANAISFHYIGWRDLYVLDYLLYSLRPFGVFKNVSLSLPQRLSVAEVLAKGLEYLDSLTTLAPSTPDNDEDH